MSDLNETIGQNMKKKPSAKLSSIKSHNFGLITILIISPSKTYGLTIKGLNPKMKAVGTLREHSSVI
ncbi:hypothetical protein [Desulfosporosinus nitroreducens]|uniref:hypothetical protein n=1 Tax=Desulfosporosinus nitroreducens TaxID=2018668 RepID=UPI003F522539